jgi:hypothetical protein
LILEKRASSHETSPGSDEDSCEDFLHDKDDDCDENDDDDEEEEEKDNDDDYFCKEKGKNKTYNLNHPVHRDIEDITGYVSIQ